MDAFGAFLWKTICISLAGVLTLSACATSSTTSGPTAGSMTAAQVEMRENSKALRKTVWQGAAAGAGAGALLGGLIGGGWKEAAIGAAAGAAAGALAGSYVSNKQRKFSNREDALDAMIADVKQKNDESDAMIASMETVVAENRRRLASAASRLEEGEISKAQYRRELASVRDDKKLINETIGDLKEQHTTFSNASVEFRKKNPKLSTEDFDQEVASLEDKIETMSSISDELVTETS